MAERNQVFICCASDDDDWRDRFVKMLQPTGERQILRVWSRADLRPGDVTSEKIQRALEESCVGLLLVTKEFFKSKSNTLGELRSLIQRARKHQVALRWVPISSALTEYSQLNDIEPCWQSDKPINLLDEPERDAAIKKICLELANAFGNVPLPRKSRVDELRSAIQDQLGDTYKIVDVLARGRHSLIYRAKQTRVQKDVVIKVLVTTELDEWARKAFLQSAQLAQQLKPPFVELLDESMQTSPEYVVLEYVAGMRLDRVLQRRANLYEPRAVKSILLSLARALKELHALGVLRGELTPSDILIDEKEEPRLSSIDFSNILLNEGLTKGSHFVESESLAYMSPERYLGQVPTPFTDQYALGLIGVTLLGGKLPSVTRPCDLEGKRDLYKDLEEGKGEWATHSSALTGVLAKMLRVAPEERWQSLEVVCEMLESTEPESPLEHARRLAKEHYSRNQSNGPAGEQRFFAQFYSNLFAQFPALQKHFGHVNMTQQHKMINQAITMLLRFNESNKELCCYLNALSDRHAGFGLTKAHVYGFRDAFLETEAKSGGADSTHIEALRTALTPGFEFIARRMPDTATIADSSD